MRWERGRILGDRIRQSWKARLGLSACAAALACAGALYLYFMGPGNIPLICVFHEVTGLYCPGCGGTRAFRLLLSGHILQSFLYHPAVVLTAVLYVWFMVSHTAEILSKGRLKIGLPYTDKFLYLEVVVIIFQCIIKNFAKIFWGTGIL